MNNGGQDGAEPSDLLALAEHPKLARGTLLMLYWRAAPGYYRRYADAAAVPDREREGYETCRALAEVYLRRSDLRDGIVFDPRDDDGYDWTSAYDDEPRRSEYASPLLLVRVPGETVAWPTGPDQLTRPPDAAEQAVIAAGFARGRALLPDLPAEAPPRAVAEAFADALRRAGPAAPADLAWLWLDALGWPWRCGDSATDGVLFGVARDTLSSFVPDIVSRTAEAGIDPAETLRFFDLVRRMPPGPPDAAFWAGSDVAFAAAWLGQHGVRVTWAGPLLLLLAATAAHAAPPPGRLAKEMELGPAFRTVGDRHLAVLEPEGTAEGDPPDAAAQLCLTGPNGAGAVTRDCTALTATVAGTSVIYNLQTVDSVAVARIPAAAPGRSEPALVVRASFSGGGSGMLTKLSVWTYTRVDGTPFNHGPGGFFMEVFSSVVANCWPAALCPPSRSSCPARPWRTCSPSTCGCSAAPASASCPCWAC